MQEKENRDKKIFDSCFFKLFFRTFFKNKKNIVLVKLVLHVFLEQKINSFKGLIYLLTVF